MHIDWWTLGLQTVNALVLDLAVGALFCSGRSRRWSASGSRRPRR